MMGEMSLLILEGYFNTRPIMHWSSFSRNRSSLYFIRDKYLYRLGGGDGQQIESENLIRYLLRFCLNTGIFQCELNYFVEIW